jgi:hypothetical protein
MVDSDPASICIPSTVSIEDCLARARARLAPGLLRVQAAPSPPGLQCSDPHLFLIADAICIAETIGTELPISYAPHVLRKYNGSHPSVHVTLIGI